MSVAQLLSSLVASLVEADDLSDEMGANVHLQSLLLFRRPATGVSGHESLSDSDESRLSPIRGARGRGELSSDEKAELDLSDKDGIVGEEDMSEDNFVFIDNDASDVLDSEDEVASDEMDDTDDSRSECAMVYLTVLISSSNGVRKDTLFSAGNMGRTGAILREVNGTGLLARIDLRLWGCLYGMVMVAESLEADVSVDERVEAELGVDVVLSSLQLLSIDRRGFDRRPRAGAAEAGGSYALEKVLRTVGETALRVSSRRLEPLPKVRTCWVSRWSLGRWASWGWRGAIMGSEVVVMMWAGSREAIAGAMGCDIVDSIMRTDRDAAPPSDRDGGSSTDKGRARRGAVSTLWEWSGAAGMLAARVARSYLLAAAEAGVRDAKHARGRRRYNICTM